ncbi:MAG: hypothetical protein B6D63_05815 [Candidatus Latescibacteria bacterium 4484_7]|nr:MAG: hypothetical protein B6D63_05815 [Candidatus Latescibacteria bacterium 4484_7]
MTTLNKGDKAPAFEIPENMEQNWKLADHVGHRNILLLFFPLAYSPTCHDEMCSMRDGFHEFQNLDAEIVAVSVDSPFVLNQWRKELELPFPLLSDFNKGVCQSYGVCYDTLGPLKGVAKRSAFVIDKSGTVQYAWVSEDPGKLPDVAAIKEVLNKLG